MNREPGLEVVLQTASLEEAHGIHLDGIDVAVADPALSDGDGLDLVREVSVANPHASALVLIDSPDPAVRERALGAVKVLTTTASA